MIALISSACVDRCQAAQAAKEALRLQATAVEAWTILTILPAEVQRFENEAEDLVKCS